MEEIDLEEPVKIHSAIVSGIFYPEDSTAAETELHAFGLEHGIGGRAAAILAPHGAWNLSGHLAGAAFSAAANRIKREKEKGISKVVLLSATHQAYGDGLFLTESNMYETPLGNLLVDNELCEEIATCSTLFEINDIPHLTEYAAEPLLPFIKFCFPSTFIIPILMGGTRRPVITALAKALRIIFEPLMDSTLFVLSSNMAKHTDASIADIQARNFLELLQTGDGEAIITAIENGTVSACGAAPAAALFESGLFTKGAPVSPLVKTITEEKIIIFHEGIAIEKAGPAV